MAITKTVLRLTKRLSSWKNVLVVSSRDQSLWTAEKVVKSPFKDVDVPNRTVLEHIWENLGRWPDKPALICGITNLSYTYHQLYKYSKNFGAKLRLKLGIQDGDVVCVMMPNSPAYAVAILGALQAGAEVTTVNPIYTAHEVQRQLMLSSPKVIIGMPETICVLKNALKLAKLDLPIIAVTTADESQPTGTISYKEFAYDNTVDHSILKTVRKKPDDIAFLPYSSGTTGLPKGVELTNRNMVTNFAQMDVDGAKNHCDTTNSSQDSILGILPFFHIYGLSVSLLHKLSVGYKVVTLPRFHPTTFLSAMKQHKINMLNAAPPLVLFMGSHQDVTKEHLAYLKVVTAGAAPVSINDILKFIEKAAPGTDFLQIYGLTETSPLASVSPPGSKNYSSAGFPVSNSMMRIVNSEMRNLGPNEVGELLIKGPHIMKGYRNNIEATKEAITEDGWYKTGDLAFIDENGSITIVDRLKELIKVKGFQVPPAELENVLKEHPSILDAAVIGIPDEKLGEAPKAFIVVKEGHSPKSDEVKKFVEERVAVYKRLKEVKIIEAIPKNPSGKILRRLLKEQ